MSERRTAGTTEESEVRWDDATTAPDDPGRRQGERNDERKVAELKGRRLATVKGEPTTLDA